MTNYRRGFGGIELLSDLLWVTKIVVAKSGFENRAPAIELI